jgi:hypothetical protein
MDKTQSTEYQTDFFMDLLENAFYSLRESLESEIKNNSFPRQDLHEMTFDVHLNSLEHHILIFEDIVKSTRRVFNDK